MAIIAKNTGQKRELVPQGNYVARCYQMIEIGTVKEEYKGVPKEHQKVRIGWEFPLELRVFDEAKGEQPLVISNKYTVSMGDKANLRKVLESWRGKAFTEEEAKAFDITKLLGVPCFLNVIHKTSEDGSKTYANIASVTPLPKGIECPPQVNPMFVLSYDEFDYKKFMDLPDFIKEEMEVTPEFKLATTTSDAPHDEPPHLTGKDEKESDLPF